jgi:predicted MPP superfamily phosphohydrolase
MAPWQHRKQRWMAALAETWQPDLVVNTGDNLGHEDGLRALRAALDPLRGIPGVFVHGSNDHAAPTPRNPLLYLTGPSKVKVAGEPLNTQALDGYLTDDLGWLNLNNAVGSLELPGMRIDAFGVSDAHRGWDELDILADLVEQLQADVAPATATLGVTHAPYRRVLDTFIDLGADLILGGHTHGGQVRIPGFGALVANCDIPLDQARGLSEWTHAGRTAPLNVSAGIGHSIYAPVRFACRPEVSLITLLPRL